MLKSITHLAWVSLIILYTTCNTFGQKNFVKGYVILPSQDTISGFVDDQNWERNPKVIHFKKTITGEMQRYGVQQIMGFGAEASNSYRKSIVQVDITPSRIEELLLVTKPKLLTDTVFLLELVRGSINLYHLSDENHKNHFFIQQKNGSIEELIQRNYLVTKNRQQMLGTYNQYKDQLQYSFLTECPALQSRIKQTPYSKTALKTLIEQYNLCLNPKAHTEIKLENQHKLMFGFLAGANSTRYTFKGADAYMPNTKFDKQQNPMIGLAFQVALPYNRQKWSIYNELAWKRHYSKSTYEHTDRWIDEKSSITIKANYVGLTTLLRYSWINKNYQPFINAGFAINRAVNLDMQLQTQRNFYTYQTSYDGPYQENHRRNVEIGVVGGAGVKIRKMAAEIRYERANGFLDLSQLSVEKKMLVFLVSYNLN